MTYYSVLDVSPTTEDWIPAYLKESGPIIKKHGGKYLARTVSHQQLEGNEQKAGLRIILEWPSKQAALDFMADPGYAEHLKARTEGSISHHYLIEGKDDFA
ncbi:DUF1330 domain-containing protein [Winogradskyella sp.]|jgi:uncharacterized protein (DUF1330 family)|uniref:DUF1330 domain-containing protein n=1 Tax=Winogradskyella sp. TaxID=1883156 RepID=UPI0025CDF035|nr:DUF1330 domain-containing protein [Winogradskyella sp.]MCT4628348.1 DUF1330 domain-containing protein [Winogradskyella sp.]